MQTPDADRRFFELLRERQVDLDESTPSVGFEALLAFYRDVRAADVELEGDGDMLLYQWGTYDWGEGERFELNLTRQLICRDGGDDDLWQLALTYRYELPDEFEGLEEGASEWCAHPDELPELREFIERSEPWRALSERAPTEVSLIHEVAG